MRLSKTEINSYCENVLPLYFVSDKDISKDEIVWKTDSDAVHIKTYSDDSEFPFSDGVLLTLMKEGTATVTATHGGADYVCKVNVRARRTANKTDELKPHPTDLHIHTAMEHDHKLFAVRTIELATDLVENVTKSGLVKGAVITDHADTLNTKDFFKGFIADEEITHEGVVFFSGAESEVTLIETDRFGLSRKNSGEIVTINANNRAAALTWEEFFDCFKESPFMIASLAHPNVIGWDQYGIWNFNLQKNARRPEFKKHMRLIEVGREDYEQSSMLYQYPYSVALDTGLKISPACTSDSHGVYKPVVGKTFLLAPDGSKEMLYDAIINNRVYASESGAVDLKFTVNGAIMGETLAPCKKYDLHIEAKPLFGKEDAAPVICDIISDYGKKLMTVDFNGSLDVTIESDTARYFYVRLIDKNALKTWSSPVWCGREFDDFSKFDRLKPIDKSDFTATDAKTGAPLDNVINGNPNDAYEPGGRYASVLIDMKKAYTVSAVSYCAPGVYIDDMLKRGIDLSHKCARFVSDYEIYLSLDGEHFEKAQDGCIKTFGGEDILPIKPTEARYVRFDALNIVADDARQPKYKDATMLIGELSVFE